MAKVLFISHDTSRTGAPIVLLHFLKWLKRSSKLEFEVVLGRGGELEQEFKKVAKVWRLWGFGLRTRSWGNLGVKLIRIPVNVLNLFLLYRLRRYMKVHKFQLVYSNTITNGWILRHLPRCPVITHVHELQDIVPLLNSRDLQLNLNRTDRFIAVSELVRENLIAYHSVSEEMIDLVHEFINLEEIRAAVPDASVSAAWREKLGIGSQCKIVGGCGSLIHRKGPDLFIKLAGLIKEMAAMPVSFVWVGGAPRDRDYFEKIAEKQGVGSIVHFVSQQKDVRPFFALFDVFAMVSRFDPFPLVCLEAAAFAVPTVCFSGGTGIKEFVGNECGRVIPDLDVSSMAKEIVEMFSAPDVLKAYGEAAFRRINEYDVGVIGPLLHGIIEKTVIRPTSTACSGGG